MFNGCENLEAVDLSMFDTSNVTNMENMFKNATKLKTIYV
jgi:surface protein